MFNIYMCGAAFLGLLAFSFGFAENRDAAARETRLTVAPIHKAGTVIDVTELAVDGKTVSFTIPDNAREKEDEAEAVGLSGIRAVDQQSDPQCPLLSSTKVSKSVENYELLSGKARVTVTFPSEYIAEMVYRSGCVLIEDKPAQG